MARGHDPRSFSETTIRQELNDLRVLGFLDEEGNVTEQLLALTEPQLEAVLSIPGVARRTLQGMSDEILADTKVLVGQISLSPAELQRLYDCGPQVVRDATDVLRDRMGDKIHVKIRDFLKVHNKGGQPCPACGGNITQLTANQRITSYCRRCQPGMLIRN